MDKVFTYPPAMASRTTKKEEERDGLTPSAAILAENLRRLMESHADLNSNPKLGRKTGLGASAISRLLSGHNSTVETLDKLALAFRLEAWHLLMPGLNPNEPPPIRSLSERETGLYQRFKEIALEVVANQS